MAPLPSIRLAMSLRAFERVAVDYGGQFISIQGREKRRQKQYLCLLTCLATRAVHLEMAFALDTDSFLNSFYRMVSRRGKPEEVVSDNGGNFVAADKELQDLVKRLAQNRIIKSAANHGIKWHFNPPLSPHVGGAHEIMIKAAKRALKKIGLKCFSRYLLVALGRKPSKPHFQGPIRRRISEEDRRNV